MPTYERKTSDIFISDELREILEIFKDKSQVARNLLHRRMNKDLLVENHVNYISTSKTSPGKISYLSQDRIEKVSKSSEEDYWETSMRFICKPGGFVSKIFKESTPKEVEDFANLYKTFSTKRDLLFKVVSGDDIARYYHQSIYYNQEDSLGNSCMKYNSCQEYFDIYTKNENISLLTLLSPDGKLLGRALLWNFDGNKIMDRIYTIQDDIYLNHMAKWAIDNGYLHKSEQNWQSCIKFFDGKEDIEKKFSIKLNNYLFNRYPYLDSFKWLDLKTGVLTNFKPEHFCDSDEFVNLSDSNGRYESADFMEFCDISRYYHHSDEVVEVGGIKCSKEYLKFSETMDKWILDTEAIYSEELEDYIYKDDYLNDQDLIDERRKEIKLLREPKKDRISILNWMNLR
jgi:hypothetical protein